MLLNPIVQNRAKHFDLLLARELALIERKHSQNLIIHEKLENSIRRANNQLLNTHRTKISIPFDNIYNEQTGSIDYHNLRNNNNNSNQKRRLSIDPNSNRINQNQTILYQSNELFDDRSSSILLQRRQDCKKSQHLPPILKAHVSNQKRKEHRNHHWMGSFQQSNISKEYVNEPFIILNEEITKPNKSTLTSIQKQVHSFLETLPTYKGVQHGFDSFAPASLYTNRAPLAIR